MYQSSNSVVRTKQETVINCLFTWLQGATVRGHSFLCPKKMGAATDWEMGAREMAEWLRALTALTQHSNSIPRTHSRWLKTTYNSRSKGSSTSDLHGHLHSHIHLYTEIHTVHIIFKSFFFLVGCFVFWGRVSLYSLGCNSLCRPGWLWTQKSVCLPLPHKC